MPKKKRRKKEIPAHQRPERGGRKCEICGDYFFPWICTHPYCRRGMQPGYGPLIEDLCKECHDLEFHWHPIREFGREGQKFLRAGQRAKLGKTQSNPKIKITSLRFDDHSPAEKIGYIAVNDRLFVIHNIGAAEWDALKSLIDKPIVKGKSAKKIWKAILKDYPVQEYSALLEYMENPLTKNEIEQSVEVAERNIESAELNYHAGAVDAAVVQAQSAYWLLLSASHFGKKYLNKKTSTANKLSQRLVDALKKHNELAAKLKHSHPISGLDEFQEETATYPDIIPHDEFSPTLKNPLTYKEVKSLQEKGCSSNPKYTGPTWMVLNHVTLPEAEKIKKALGDRVDIMRADKGDEGWAVVTYGNQERAHVLTGLARRILGLPDMEISFEMNPLDLDEQRAILSSAENQINIAAADLDNQVYWSAFAHAWQAFHMTDLVIGVYAHPGFKTTVAWQNLYKRAMGVKSQARDIWGAALDKWHEIRGVYDEKTAPNPRYTNPISPLIRREVNAALRKEGLDGNGRFESMAWIVNKINEILGYYNMEIIDLITPYTFPGQSGHKSLSFGITPDDDYYSPEEIDNSMVAISYYKHEDGRYDAVVYLS